MAESQIVLDIIQKSKDVLHNAFKTLDIVHSECHQGNLYNARLSTTVLGASSWLMFQINTPENSEVHLTAEFNNSAGLIEFLKLESPTTMTNGTVAVIPINHNRQSTKTSTLTLYSNPTGVSLSSTATSTQAGAITIRYEGSTGTGGGGGVRGQTGNYRDAQEWVLKANSTYVYKITNLAGASGYASFNLLWYEIY